MQYRFGSNFPGSAHPVKLARMMAHESRAARMLQGCAVVNADGDLLGHVSYLMVDRLSHHLRFVIVCCRDGGAKLALPWKSLHFDPAGTRLVFCHWH